MNSDFAVAAYPVVRTVRQLCDGAGPPESDPAGLVIAKLGMLSPQDRQWATDLKVPSAHRGVRYMLGSFATHALWHAKKSSDDKIIQAIVPRAEPDAADLVKHWGENFGYLDGPIYSGYVSLTALHTMLVLLAYPSLKDRHRLRIAAALSQRASSPPERNPLAFVAIIDPPAPGVQAAPPGLHIASRVAAAAVALLWVVASLAVTVLALAQFLKKAA